MNHFQNFVPKLSGVVIEDVIMIDSTRGFNADVVAGEFLCCVVQNISGEIILGLDTTELTLEFNVSDVVFAIPVAPV